MTAQVEHVTKCRICEKELPEPFFNLGNQPLANNLLNPSFRNEDVYELALCQCTSCQTVQLTQTIAPEILFRDYVWVTGTASTTRAYAQKFYENVSKRMTKSSTIRITEIASNDGTFLKPFRDAGHVVQGIDPARNIAEIAEQKGIPTLAEFFSKSVALEQRQNAGFSDVIIARNVIPHVADVNDVIAGIECLLDDQGIGIIEFHDAGVIQSELHYDSIYHEHIFYFTLLTLEHLLNKHNLFLFDIEISPISGGSWVVFFSKDVNRQQSTALCKNKEKERQGKVNEAKTWRAFSTACALHAEELKSVLRSYSDKGLNIVGYGASARSSTMLNYCELSHSNISVIADQNTMKQGLLAPGSHIPIVDPARTFDDNVDVVLLCAWNFKQEIVELLRDKLKFSGAIILPLPNQIEII